MAENPVHYRIHVYVGDARPPHDEPVETTLCPGGRSTGDRTAVWPLQVTCRRCRELMNVLWLDNPEAPGNVLSPDES